MTLLAHRGVTAQARDNSAGALAAVSHAACSGVPLGIEMDIRATADDLVLNHDPFEWGVPLFDVPMSDLRAQLLDECPITLSEGLSLLQNVPVIDIEIKEDDTAKQTIDHVIRHCEETGKPISSFLFVSFIPRAIAEVKQIDPRFKTGMLIEGNLTTSRPSPDRVCLTLDDEPDQMGIDIAETMWRVADHVNADFLSPHWTILNRLVLDLATERNKHVLPWSVNHRHLLVALMERPEVMHVVTDFPGLMFPDLGQPLTYRKFAPLSDSH